MDNSKSKWLKSLPIIGSVIAIVSGGFGIWGYIKPTEEVPDLKGVWQISITVTDASDENYLDDVMVYQVFIIQDGTELTGSGEQILYNDKPAQKRFKVDPFTGLIDGDQVTITYLLHGNGRDTEAMLKLKLDPEDDKRLTGTYRGNAANQAGTVEIKID